MSSLVIEIDWLGHRIRTFRDLIPEHPRAVFVGLNPSPISLDAGHYHQGRLGKRMWRRLERTGIITLPPPGSFHDEWSFHLGFGLTDIVKRPSPRGDLLTRADFAHGRARLLALLDEVRPPLIGFIYKRVAEETFRKRLTCNAGLIPGSLCGSRLFLLPGPYSDKATACRVLGDLKALIGA